MLSLKTLFELTNIYFIYILTPLVAVLWILITYLLIRRNLRHSAITTWHKLKLPLLIALLPLIAFLFVVIGYLYIHGLNESAMIKRAIVETVLIILCSFGIFLLILWRKKISYRIAPLFLKSILIGLLCSGTLFIVGKAGFIFFRGMQPAWAEAEARAVKVEKMLAEKNRP